MKGTFVMFKFFKILLISFCILTTTVAFGKSTHYFETTLAHMLSDECNRSCRTRIIESEVDIATILILKIVGKELQQKLIQLEKEVYD
jgi:hypothetical protein|tara:strand:+ start:15 stop:278 length:264 start_codon:yes stop_codon:yes gene_type:complete